jgi:hypothetical protein
MSRGRAAQFLLDLLHRIDSAVAISGRWEPPAAAVAIVAASRRGAVELNSEEEPEDCDLIRFPYFFSKKVNFTCDIVLDQLYQLLRISNINKQR